LTPARPYYTFLKGAISPQRFVQEQGRQGEVLAQGTQEDPEGLQVRLRKIEEKDGKATEVDFGTPKKKTPKKDKDLE
jgi:hypothetical protein